MNDWRRFSRLPQSPEYWQRVTARMLESAGAVEIAPAEPVRSLVPLMWMALAASLVAVLSSTLLPQAPATALSLQSGLAPADPLAAVWVDSPRPPDATELLLSQMGAPK